MTRASGTNRRQRHANPARRSDTKADRKGRPGRPKPKKIPSGSVLRGGYRGFCPLEMNGAGISGGGGRVERKHWTELNPRDFFEGYVNARKPLVISTDGVSGGALGMLFGLKGEAANWSLPGLEGMKAMRSSGAANCEVFVERRPEKSSLFGQSDDVSREKTTFGNFCRELESGNELGYLTTQALEDADGCPKSLAADHVLKLLTGCQSLRPNLIGNLTPVQYNMWFGRSSEGSSSGLHHDFHDNIYVLLRGRKEFRLFSPRCLDVLAPAGLRQAQLHSNGLISYVPGLRDDGAPTVAVRDWREGAKQGSSVNQQLPMNDSSEDEEELEQMLNDVLSADVDAGSDQPEQGSLPDSFCRASTMSSRAPIPKILEGRHITADLGVGDLLYLPASWFHEVISYGGDSGGHLALNLWMAPPHWGSTWQAPYEDGFWESFFQKMNPMQPSAEADRMETARSEGRPHKSFAKVRQKSKRLPFTHAARLPRRRI